MAYDAQKAKKKEFAAKAYVEYLKKPYECPIMAYFFFGMPLPSKTKKSDRVALLHSPHVSTPDLDNLIKFACDACNEILWTDDKLIYKCIGHKYYANEPHTRIIIVPHIVQTELTLPHRDLDQDQYQLPLQ